MADNDTSYEQQALNEAAQKVNNSTLDNATSQLNQNLQSKGITPVARSESAAQTNFDTGPIPDYIPTTTPHGIPLSDADRRQQWKNLQGPYGRIVSGTVGALEALPGVKAAEKWGSTPEAQKSTQDIKNLYPGAAKIGNLASTIAQMFIPFGNVVKGTSLGPKIANLAINAAPQAVGGALDVGAETGNPWEALGTGAINEAAGIGGGLLASKVLGMMKRGVSGKYLASVGALPTTVKQEIARLGGSPEEAETAWIKFIHDNHLTNPEAIERFSAKMDKKFKTVDDIWKAKNLKLSNIQDQLINNPDIQEYISTGRIAPEQVQSMIDNFDRASSYSGGINKVLNPAIKGISSTNLNEEAAGQVAKIIKNSADRYVFDSAPEIAGLRRDYLFGAGLKENLIREMGRKARPNTVGSILGVSAPLAGAASPYIQGAIQGEDISDPELARKAINRAALLGAPWLVGRGGYRLTQVPSTSFGPFGARVGAGIANQIMNKFAQAAQPTPAHSTQPVQTPAQTQQINQTAAPIQQQVQTQPQASQFSEDEMKTKFQNALQIQWGAGAPKIGDPQFDYYYKQQALATNNFDPTNQITWKVYYPNDPRRQNNAYHSALLASQVSPDDILSAMKSTTFSSGARDIISSYAGQSEEKTNFDNVSALAAPFFHKGEGEEMTVAEKKAFKQMLVNANQQKTNEDKLNYFVRELSLRGFDYPAMRRSGLWK
ncbi:MAG TPA: hypothetical protein VMD05_08025 [Candidatus Nanoarchaeia archaeon]|nr:hypothetical protein [Candidatus Nanoarchaeia archaeon]